MPERFRIYVMLSISMRAKKTRQMFYIPSGSPGLKSLYHRMPERLENRCSMTNRKIFTEQMMQCVATLLLVLCGLLICSHAKENQCPGEKASCPDDSTCCVLSNGSFGCCPIQNAVCCGDSVHCCPDGYTCDVVNGICKMGRKFGATFDEVPYKTYHTMLQKPSVLKTEMLVALNPANKLCPDGTRCPNTNTCCRSRRGGYACCRLRRAVCCPDLRRCCPFGSVCSFLDTCLGPGPSSVPKQVYF